jgi:hypothetical protein
MIATRTATGATNDTALAGRAQVGVYRVAEVVTLARDGSPVGWPLAPELEGDRIVFSTGYVYPAKARNAQRDPRVAVLFSDPTASGRADADPLVLVQGRCEVLDADLQANTEPTSRSTCEAGRRWHRCSGSRGCASSRWAT